jgi:hypothetical protein
MLSSIFIILIIVLIVFILCEQYFISIRHPTEPFTSLPFFFNLMPTTTTTTKTPTVSTLRFVSTTTLLSTLNSSLDILKKYVAYINGPMTSSPVKIETINTNIRDITLYSPDIKKIDTLFKETSILPLLNNYADILNKKDTLTNILKKSSKTEYTTKIIQSQINCQTTINKINKKDTPLPLQAVYGNNGSVTGNKYCAGTKEKSWNNELPSKWTGATCNYTFYNGEIHDCSSNPVKLSGNFVNVCKQSTTQKWAT